MNERQKSKLKQHRVPIVDDLEPRGTVLDCLCEDDILTENDAEEVSSATTRKERCQALLRLIQRRGPSAYGSFKRALKKSSLDHLATLLDIERDNCREENGNTPERESVLNRNCDALPEYDGFLDRVNGNEAIYKANHPNRTNNRPRLSEAHQNACFTNDRYVEGVQKLSYSQLENHVPLIVDNVEPRDLYDVLIQDGVLTEDEVEDIGSLRTRREKCARLVQIVSGKIENDCNVINSLMKALSRKYKFVVDAMNNGKPHNDSGREICCCDKIMGCDQTEIGADLSDEVPGMDNASIRVSVTETGDPTDINDNPETTARRKKSLDPEPDSADIYERRDDNVNVHVSNCDLVTYKLVEAIPSKRQGKRLGLAFDYLSTLVNQGDFTNFDSITNNLIQRRFGNPDLMCIVGYLKACKNLFQADFDSATQNVKSTMKLVPKSSNPRYFTLELLSANIRRFIIQKKFGKLTTTLEDAMMLMETDPAGCSGRAAGWLCINDARNMTTQMSCLNMGKPNAMKTYEKLFLRAKRSLERSISNFKKDGGKDGPFGFGFALTRLVVLLMRCGDNGKTMDVLAPIAEDIPTANKYIQTLEDSDIELSKILKMHFCLAKCDYQYRRNNLKRATEHAQSAFELATEMNILEFKDHARNRLVFLNLTKDASAQSVEREFHATFMVSNSEEEFDGDTTDN